MNKKTYSITLSIIILIILSCAFSVKYIKQQADNITTQKTELKELTDWNTNTNTATYRIKEQFDLKSILTGNNNNFNTFFFKGKIVDIKSYEVTWTDEYDEKWGPFQRNIISVQLDKIYTNTKLENKRIFRVLTTEPLNNTDNSSLKINIGDDYVFLNCWALDDKYFEQISKDSKNSIIYDTSLQQADVIMGGIWNSMFPIDNNKVLIYHEYFSNMPDITKHTLSTKTSEFDKFISDKNLFSNDYIIVNMRDFEKAIDTLIKNYN